MASDRPMEEVRSALTPADVSVTSGAEKLCLGTASLVLRRKRKVKSPAPLAASQG